MSKTSGANGSGGELHQRSKVDLTSNQGTVLSDNQNSLKAGVRGPTLLEDFLLREKITHFDHERIPERIVHARGTGAKGKFRVYESLADITKAAFLQDPGAETEAFVRFSTVAGGAGSNDTVRDVRGFAVKLYTSEGNFDLVGNNIPVFFIQDAIKFPDLIHSVKMEPDRGFPQAASAHDTFWDFVSLMPESLHMVTWAMSDRALPRSYRMMDGFGIHTFRLVNAKGAVQLCKFHWRPVLGMASLVWNEAVKLQGADSDFHRRDLWTAIENGDFPEWELGLQVFEEERAATFDFDVLDSTKLIPEEIVPVRIVGKLTLDRNVDNFFAETEQVAFHPGHIVPGIDFSEDPLLQGRLHSYLDTQLSRLGGPNFHEIPVNRPRCPMHNFQRDGLARQDVAKGRVAYEPNSLAPDGPRENPDKGFASVEQTFGAAQRVRERSPSFADHYSQARLFFQSQTPIEQDHIVDAFSFELAKVETPAIRQRVLGHLHIVDEALGKRVQANLGEKDYDHAVKAAVPPKNLPASPALSLLDRSKGTLQGRKIGVLVSDGAPAALLASIEAAAKKAGAAVELVAPRIGNVNDDKGSPLTIHHTVSGGPSVIFDHVVVAPGSATLEKDPAAIDWVRDAFGHRKVIGHTDGASALFKAAHVKPAADRGVVALTQDAAPFVKSALEGRVWDRRDLAARCQGPAAWVVCGAMGTVLVVGGWVQFGDAAAKEAWCKKRVASTKLGGWDEPLVGPGESSPFDKHTIGALWEEAQGAPEPIEIAETETGLRFAAALASVTGREVWAPAFFAAVRRAAGSGQGGAWAFAADEGGAVMTVDLAGKGSFRRLDEDDAIAIALAEPELVRAFALIAGETPPPTLADLPPRAIEASRGGGKSAKAKLGPRGTSAPKAPARPVPLPAKPAPRLKKITARAPGGLSGVTRLAGGDAVMIGLFGAWIRGDLATNTWTARPLGLGKLRWITTQGVRIWLGGDEGLFVSDDDGATFARRQPPGFFTPKPLFVEGAIIGAPAGELARSNDDGASWTPTFPLDRGFGAVSLARGTGEYARRIVAVGIYGRIAVSDDLGQTFTMVRDGQDEAFNAVCIDGEDVFIVGSTRVLRAPIERPGDVVAIGPAHCRDADFEGIHAAEGTLWITGTARLLRSRDRGASWEIIAEKPVVFTDLVALGPRHLLVTTSESAAWAIEG